MPADKGKNKLTLMLLCTAGILSAINIILILTSLNTLAIIDSLVVAALIFAFFMSGRRTSIEGNGQEACTGEGACQSAANCELLETEKEAAISSLKAHLSEQRHDLLNVLQIVYGYTQLKKPERVLSQINTYSKKMENIGAIYNAKCIKLADLLYTKGKEAEIIDLQLHYDVKITFEPVIRMLECKDILYVLDGIISNAFFAFYKAELRNCNLVYVLRENESSFDMEVCFRDTQDGQYIDLPEALPYAEEDFYWNKISREIPSVQKLNDYCMARGYELSLQNGIVLFKLKINK